MLRTIGIDQLRLGMHIQAFEGAWIDHPFWRTKFVLADPADLRKIIDSGIPAVVIDTELGADVASESAADPESAVAHEIVLAPNAPAAKRPKPRRGEAGALKRKARLQAIALYDDARMGRAIDTGAYASLVDDIVDSVCSVPDEFISLMRLHTHDEYTYMHSVSVCALMIGLGRSLGMTEAALRDVGMAGLFHDVGKALMPQDILNKPGALDDAEYALMKSHPERGYELLRQARDVSSIALDVCLHHHEKFDGTGYPRGQAGEAISLHARMGAVCDVYDAITSDRPYKRAWDPAESLRRMAQWKGHFDPVIFQAFVKTVGIYPTGSLVRLASGRLAVVLVQNANALLKPVVKVFYSATKRLHLVPEIIDLARTGCRDAIEGPESPSNWSFEHLPELWAAPDAIPA